MRLEGDHTASEQGRAAVEHGLNRRLNERLSNQEEQGGARRLPRLLVCECGRPDCAETVEVSATEYEAARSSPHLYLVAAGHQSPGVTDVIVEVPRRFTIVELIPSAVAAAARQDLALDGERSALILLQKNHNEATPIPA
jgi:hypothetical protein